jgi:PEP-CTERM motif
MRVLTFTFAVSLCLGTSLAHAHGPQLQITDDNNKLVTRQIILDDPYSDSLTDPKSVYVIPVQQFNGIWYSQPNSNIDPILMQVEFPSGPGLAYGYDQVVGGPQVFASGSRLSENFITGLKRWDGSAFVDPGTGQIGAFPGSHTAPPDQAITSDSGPFSGITFPAIPAGYDEDAHFEARFRLLGDGTNPLSLSQDGVYLLSLQVTSTQGGLAPSDPFYFVLRKNATDKAVVDAVNALTTANGIAPSLVQYVPEPASLMLFAAGLVCLVVMRRR